MMDPWYTSYFKESSILFGLIPHTALQWKTNSYKAAGVLLTSIGFGIGSKFVIGFMFAV